MASPPTLVSSTGAHTDSLCSIEALELRAEAVPAVGLFSLFVLSVPPVEGAEGVQAGCQVQESPCI